MLKQVLKIGLGISVVASTLMATPEKTKLKIGFIALTDCAPLVIAKEKGFFKAEGLDVHVVKEGGGWPGIQQKVISGEYDFSHALAGMPIAATLGINGNANLVALLSLDLNGNAITYGNNIIKEMEKYGLDKTKRPVSAESLKKYIDAKHKAEGANYKPLTFGMVHPVSTHNYELRYWMAASGIKPDEDCTIKPFPPPTMPSNLIAGNIEGYCVGEPWNSRIVLKGEGSALVTNYDIWNNNPEKVLQARADFVKKNPETTKAVMRAVLKAQMWLDESWEHREEAIKYLAQNNYVKAPVSVLRKSMSGTFLYNKGVDSKNPMFNVFANDYAAYPFYSHGMWFITQMYRWGQLDHAVNMKEVIEKVYRPDLFAVVAKEVGYTLPPSPWKKDGVDEYNKFLDGKVWDPNKAVDYIYDFKVQNSLVSKEELAKANNWTVETKQPAYVCPYGPAGCADPKYVTKK
ncbi:NMT1/THI5 like domain protein [Arcobacter nitrofigilis DSM 7299]|uniref:NMT1/THI5 like domain protein n=1 Tax=Arcobacter nitrofigilis (strain ATCC 33309 / DSM 7299 / CCUG 15893 / LMG 7604 / NCTC 12251 / CI) TaxID=572480 RepID=D5V5N3_ARCNC|nr:CmpA/NrtA family ABC transporter substrate-binding protein [Arcobacter nitrofigilis]ADG92069.1 NMT1/THI5 like domain protein [Arcobacter nitrofigilis DSM 7299]